jgi:hypothetical protein
MRSSTRKPPQGGAIGTRLLLALALAGVLGSAAMPARADDDWRHQRIERERIEREREWRAHHRRPVYVAPPPAYVYAPPPVVYAPPPPAAGINLIFPLTIR